LDSKGSAGGFHDDWDESWTRGQNRAFSADRNHVGASGDEGRKVFYFGAGTGKGPASARKKSGSPWFEAR